jgi:hypothetical protein
LEDNCGVEVLDEHCWRQPSRFQLYSRHKVIKFKGLACGMRRKGIDDISNR